MLTFQSESIIVWVVSVSWHLWNQVRTGLQPRSVSGVWARHGGTQFIISQNCAVIWQLILREWADWKTGIYHGLGQFPATSRHPGVQTRDLQKDFENWSIKCNSRKFPKIFENGYYKCILSILEIFVQVPDVNTSCFMKILKLFGVEWQLFGYLKNNKRSNMKCE